MSSDDTEYLQSISWDTLIRGGRKNRNSNFACRWGKTTHFVRKCEKHLTPSVPHGRRSPPLGGPRSIQNWCRFLTQISEALDLNNNPKMGTKVNHKSIKNAFRNASLSLATFRKNVDWFCEGPDLHFVWLLQYNPYIRMFQNLIVFLQNKLHK